MGQCCGAETLKVYYVCSCPRWFAYVLEENKSREQSVVGSRILREYLWRISKGGEITSVDFQVVISDPYS